VSQSPNLTGDLCRTAAECPKLPSPSPSLQLEYHRSVTSHTAVSQAHKFIIHKEFICYYSPFFSAAFKGNTQKMELNDVDPQVFGILANWLYSQEGADAEKKTPDLVACAKLWILGDRFLMRKLQNDTMKKIYAVLVSARAKRAWLSNSANSAESQQIRSLMTIRCSRLLSTRFLPPQRSLISVRMRFLLDLAPCIEEAYALS
jgi:hypothetical protein